MKFPLAGLQLLTLIVIGLCLTVDSASGQQRPFATEDPETVGAGHVLAEFGLDYGRNVGFPVSGLSGDLLSVPNLGFSFGISSIAEIQLDGVVYQRLRITGREPALYAHRVNASGNVAEEVGDLVVGTKLRLTSETERRPSFGVRLATRLPNASDESGIGLDTMDFYASLLMGKTTASTRYVVNLGLGICGDPTRGDRQSDLVTYGVSFAHGIRSGVELVGEANGRFDVKAGPPSPGGESRLLFRGGMRYTFGPRRIDGALLIGAAPSDPSIGFTVGYTHVFNAFHLP